MVGAFFLDSLAETFNTEILVITFPAPLLQNSSRLLPKYTRFGNKSATTPEQVCTKTHKKPPRAEGFNGYGLRFLNITHALTFLLCS